MIEYLKIIAKRKLYFSFYSLYQIFIQFPYTHTLFNYWNLEVFCDFARTWIKLFGLSSPSFSQFFARISSCSSWQNWYTVAQSGSWASLLRPFFYSVHEFSTRFRSGLCKDHSNTFTLLSLSQLVTALEVDHCSAGKPSCGQDFTFPADVLRFCISEQ